LKVRKNQTSSVKAAGGIQLVAGGWWLQVVVGGCLQWRRQGEAEIFPSLSLCKIIKILIFLKYFF
jgi:hypothetical protein